MYSARDRIFFLLNEGTIDSDSVFRNVIENYLSDRECEKLLEFIYDECELEDNEEEQDEEQEDQEEE